ncbi:MAG: sigma-54-dependent transcriptional regulator [Planctomycetota bacterium]
MQIIEDDASLRDLLANELRAAGHRVGVAATGTLGLEAVRAERPAVVLLDLKLPDADGEQLLAQLLAFDERPQVIVLTAHGSVDVAVRAMKAGAVDFLEKPCRLAELLLAVERAAERAALEFENRALKHVLDRTVARSLNLSVDASPSVLTRELEKIAASELPALILGETGAGKEVTARLLHQKSPRAGGPFVVVDCAALQPALIESELFGHERGAFTGAQAARVGLVEVARGGTVFLDEIGELEAGLQAKLLRLLEAGEFRRVGASKYQRAEARFIAATHRDLAAQVREGRFREDLYFRLNVLTIKVPSLRERAHEIAPLAESFLRASDSRGRLKFAPETLARLARYDWPGNVRELRNVIERLAVLAEGPIIEPTDLPPEIRRAAEPAPDSSDTRLESIEQRHILQVLEQTGGNKTRAAELLDISPTTLYAKLKRYAEGTPRPPDRH